MERDQFLDAQLWLRRVSAADWDALAVAGDSEQLLPPLSTTTSVVAWCCFHVGARLCVFAHSTEGDDDATQLKLELRSQPNRLAPPLLLARFDRRLAYAVDLRAVTAVVAPSQQPPQTEALPFGSLELPHVSVRLWIEPQHADPATARLLLQQALLAVQQSARAARERLPATAKRSEITQQSSWRDMFRHSRYASVDSAALPVTTPAELLHRARTIFERDADLETVKVTCWQIVRAQQAARTTNRRTPRASRADDETVQPPSHLLDAPLAETDVALLLTELTHIFGDRHDGVNELLGFTRGDACHDHDQCVALRDDSTTSVTTACVTAKWQAWDAFLEASSFAPRTADPSFQRAVVSGEDAVEWRERSERHRTQLRAFERVGFDAFFPSEQQPATLSPARQLQQQLEAEQLLAVLLEKRKQLLRDELALALLPRRAPDVCSSR